MSRAPDLRAPDYLDGLQRLLPRGRAWPRGQDAALTALLAGIADPLAQLHARVLALLETEADPAQAIELLPEWEAAFGLPDPCVPAGSELTLRRAALLAKITAQGGQARDYMVALAAQLGFTITITELRPYQVGSPIGTPLYDSSWRYVWQVNAPGVTLRLWAIGSSAVGDPLRSWDSTVLECVLNRVAPAETRLLFQYGS